MMKTRSAVLELYYAYRRTDGDILICGLQRSESE
jgi:hypothetical protein